MNSHLLRRGLLPLLLAAGLTTTAATVNAVVESWDATVSCRDVRHVTTRLHSVTRVLNDHATDPTSFKFLLSDNERLTEFSVTVSDPDGNVLKRLKKGDLKRSELSRELASSNYTLSLDYTPPRYPVIIEQQWTLDEDDATLEFLPFMPVTGPGISLTRATYEMRLPPERSVHSCVTGAETLTDRFRVTTAGEQATVITAAIDSIAAVGDERFMPYYRDVLPAMRFVPDWIAYLGTTGWQRTWTEAGRWLGSLTTPHDPLPADFAARLHAAADTCSTARGKVLQAYKLLGQATRYVSIQLGIGGLKPMAASKVCTLAMGDCKGLSNFMRAMLDELGISATCAAVLMGNRPICTDLPGTGQFSHMILRVNLPGDTLWVECTDPTLPLGYVHNSIAGNHALAIGGDSDAGLVRVANRPDSLNRKTTLTTVNVLPDGDAELTINVRYENGRYESVRSLVTAKPDEQRHMLLDRMDDIKSYRVRDVRVSEHNAAFEPPAITVNASIEAMGLCNKVGRRLIVPALPATEHVNAMRPEGTREHPVYIERGAVEQQTTTIIAPEGYVVTGIPVPSVITTPMGTYSFHSALSDDRRSVVVTSRLEVRGGTYPSSTYVHLCRLLNEARSKTPSITIAPAP